MANHLIAHKRRMGIEGGAEISMVHDDSGNWTLGIVGHGTLIGSKYGISAPTLCQYLKRTASIDDMKNLTEATAIAIYKVNYWDIFWGDKIINQDVANDIYDGAVNLGFGTDIKFVQEALENVPVTGKMNQLTLDKLNNAA